MWKTEIVFLFNSQLVVVVLWLMKNTTWMRAIERLYDDKCVALNAATLSVFCASRGHNFAAFCIPYTMTSSWFLGISLERQTRWMSIKQCAKDSTFRLLPYGVSHHVIEVCVEHCGSISAHRIGESKCGRLSFQLGLRLIIVFKY